MNVARIQSLLEVATPSWPKLTLIAVIGVFIGFALALALPLSVS